jgi:hypothetical protein
VLKALFCVQGRSSRNRQWFQSQHRQLSMPAHRHEMAWHKEVATAQPSRKSSFAAAAISPSHPPPQIDALLARRVPAFVAALPRNSTLTRCDTDSAMHSSRRDSTKTCAANAAAGRCWPCGPTGAHAAAESLPLPRGPYSSPCSAAMHAAIVSRGAIALRPIRVLWRRPRLTGRGVSEYACGSVLFRHIRPRLLLLRRQSDLPGARSRCGWGFAVGSRHSLLLRRGRGAGSLA